MSKRSQRKVKNRPREVWVWWKVSGVFILLGIALLIPFGNRFVFHNEAQFDQIRNIAFVVLLPLIAVARLMRPLMPEEAADPRDSLLFTGFSWIFMTLAFAVALIFSATGYVTALSAALGQARTVNASTCCERESETTEQTRCDRFSTIVYRDRKTEVCVDDFDLPEHRIGERHVLLKIRESPLGYNIDALSFSAPPVPE